MILLYFYTCMKSILNAIASVSTFFTLLGVLYFILNFLLGRIRFLNFSPIVYGIKIKDITFLIIGILIIVHVVKSYYKPW